MNHHSQASRRNAARSKPPGLRPDAHAAVRRPTVPGNDEQRLDTDYDPDPALEPTPLKNAPPRR